MHDILTVYEAAAFLRVSPTCIYNWLHAGVIPARKVGARWMITANMLDKLIDPANRPAERQR